MFRFTQRAVNYWIGFGARFLPFADAATPDLPLSRLLRLSLFQISVGMALVLLVGTLNRVMIVELNVPASLVGVMISLPLLFAPFRAVIGFKLGRPQVRPRLAAGALHVSRHHGAVLRARDHAVRAAGAVGHRGGVQGAGVARAGRRGRRVPAGRRRTAHDSDHRTGARHRSRQRRVAAEGGRPHVHHDAARHDGERARLRRLPAGFHARPAGSGHSGAPRWRPSCSTSSRFGSRSRAGAPTSMCARASRALPNPGRASPPARTRCAVWPRSASAPWRSAWKTCCSSPMAGRCSASRSATPRN